VRHVTAVRKAREGPHKKFNCQSALTPKPCP